METRVATRRGGCRGERMSASASRRGQVGGVTPPRDSCGSSVIARGRQPAVDGNGSAAAPLPSSSSAGRSAAAPPPSAAPRSTARPAQPCRRACSTAGAATRPSCVAPRGVACAPSPAVNDAGSAGQGGHRRGWRGGATRASERSSARCSARNCGASATPPSRGSVRRRRARAVGGRMRSAWAAADRGLRRQGHAADRRPRRARDEEAAWMKGARRRRAARRRLPLRRGTSASATWAKGGAQRRRPSIGAAR